MSASSRRSPLLGPTQLAAPQNLTPTPQLAPLTRELLQPIVIQRLAAPSPLDILVEMDQRERSRHRYPLLSPQRIFNPRIYESIQPVVDVDNPPVLVVRVNFGISIAAGATENETRTLQEILDNASVGNGESVALRPRQAFYADILTMRISTSTNTSMTELNVDGFAILWNTQPVNVGRVFFGQLNLDLGSEVAEAAITKPIRVHKKLSFRFVNAGVGAESQNVDIVMLVAVSQEEFYRILAASL